MKILLTGAAGQLGQALLPEKAKPLLRKPSSTNTVFYCNNSRGIRTHVHKSQPRRAAILNSSNECILYPSISTAIVRESLDKRGLSGGIEQKREPLAVNYL
jgi:hypothetical protein